MHPAGSLESTGFSWGRNCTSTSVYPLSRSVWCVRARDQHPERDVSPHPDRGLMEEKVWRELSSHPSHWWDHRSETVNPGYPDLQRKKEQQGLWIIHKSTPSWMKAELATERYVSPDPIPDRKIMREGLWREFFSDPSQWWDHRSEKVNPRYPDFKHKRTGQSLWLVDKLTPAWAEAELAAMAPNLLQSHIFSWHVRLRRHAEAGEYEKTLNLFQEMQREGMMPDKFTFVPVLNACSNLRSLKEGRRVHEMIIQRGCEADIYVASCLVDMYAKCGSIGDAWRVFNKLRNRDVVSWNAMIGGYVKSEQGLKALELFQKMQQEGVDPNRVTFIGVLHACASLVALEEGRSVHKQIILRGCESDVYVANCLVDMYAKCGSIEDAWSVFNRMSERSVVFWNVMIGAYVKSEQGSKALELFRRMQQEGVEPDTITFVGALNACASVEALDEGRRVHEEVLRRGCGSDVYVATCLIDMYSRCGTVGDSRSVFNKMGERNVVSWNAMIGGYVKSEQGLEALELFQIMQQESVEPNAVTFVGVLNACAIVAALEEGRRAHKQIIQRGYESDVYVVNCLVDMYAKCGSIKDAQSVFNKMQERNVVSWNAMIGGYAMHGHLEEAVELFERMDKEGLEINQITFICLLSACSHRGLVEKGQHYFKTMTSDHNILPTREHYGCMVDLLGRAGQLEEAEEKAEEMMKRMPLERDSCVWMSLLGACRIHVNIEIAERAAKRCWELDPKNVSAHVLLSNIYAAAGKWGKGAPIEQERLSGKVWKVPGRTWIEVKHVVHSFLVYDNEHPQLRPIRAELKRLSMKMNEEGYTTDTRFLSPEETEDCDLCRHSEKLAITTPHGTSTPYTRKIPEFALNAMVRPSSLQILLGGNCCERCNAINCQ